MNPQRAALLPGRSTRAPLDLAGVAADATTRVRRGAYVLSAEWDALFSESRLRTRAHAVAQRITNPRTALSHSAAAAFHGLPLYRVPDDRVDTIVPGPNARHSSGDVVRHHMALPERDVAVIDGVRVTTLDRTIYDLIRSVSLEAAVVCFDAALRAVAWNELTQYNADAAGAFRARVAERIQAHPGARGIRQARFVAEFADGRAQLPGESVSRVWMWQLNVPTPVLQHRVTFPDGPYALLDFAWPAQRRWAEFDGAAKYTDAGLLAGRTADQVIAAQHARQARVERATGWRCDRWGFDRMRSLDAFAEHLRSRGIHAHMTPSAAR